MNTMDDPYAVLGLEPSATWDEVQTAYRDRSLRYHPDRGGDAWAFKQVQAAYEKIAATRSEAHGPANESNRPENDKQAPSPKVRKDWFSELPVWQPVTAVATVMLLILLAVLGFQGLLWLFLGVAVIVAAGAVWMSRQAQSTEERQGLWIIAGASAVTTIVLWLGIGWLNSAEEPQAQAANTPTSQPSVSLPAESPRSKSSEPGQWSPTGRAKGIVRAITFVHERFGIGGLMAAFVIVSALYGWYNSRRSRAAAKAATPKPAE